MQIQSVNNQNFNSLTIDLKVKPLLERQLLERLGNVPEKIMNMADKIKVPTDSMQADLIVSAAGDVIIRKKSSISTGEIFSEKQMLDNFLAALEKFPEYLK